MNLLQSSLEVLFAQLNLRVKPHSGWQCVRDQTPQVMFQHSTLVVMYDW